MIRVEIGNAVSQILQVSAEDLKVIRHHVSYRAQILPPVAAQHIIKGFFSAKRRVGSAADLSRLWRDGATAAKLEEVGVSQSDLTIAMLESTLRQRGTWDGWTRMVERNGKFPTGLLDHVKRAITIRLQQDYEVIDQRQQPKRGEKLPTPDLFGFQREAVDAFLASSRGVINLPPRSGKTRIALAAICEINVPTIYLVPTVGIAKQTAKVIQGHLTAFGKTTMALTGGLSSISAKKHRQILSPDILISTPQTAAKIPNLASRQMLIVDEFHHSAAKTWQDVSRLAAGAYWRMGLTGTHFRADGKDMEMTGVLARAVYKRTVGEMVEVGRLVPAKIAMVRVHGPRIESGGYDLYRDGIVAHDQRNKTVAYAASLLAHHGKRVLVLTKEVGHAHGLAAAIPGAVAVDGADNDNVDVQLQALADGKVSVVVGTSVIGEGRDVPAADALVYAAGGKSRVKVTQDYFRVLTASSGKSVGVIIDVADAHSPKLADHAARRLQLYRCEAAFSASVIEVDQLAEWLG